MIETQSLHRAELELGSIPSRLRSLAKLDPEHALALDDLAGRVDRAANDIHTSDRRIGGLCAGMSLCDRVAEALQTVKLPARESDKSAPGHHFPWWHVWGHKHEVPAHPRFPLKGEDLSQVKRALEEALADART